MIASSAQSSVLPASTNFALEDIPVALETGIENVSIASNSIDCAATILTLSDLIGKARSIENVTPDSVRLGPINGVMLGTSGSCDQSALPQ